MKEETKTCKKCGHEIPKKSKKCPRCGTDQRGFVQKNIIMILIIAVVAAVLIICVLASGKISIAKNDGYHIPVISSDSETGTDNSDEYAEDSETEEESDATAGEINALDSALSYLDSGEFSKSGLKEQLKYEGYKKKEVSYAIKNCGANWNTEAAEAAESYLDSDSFSKSELIKQLEFEGFTHKQAVHGVNVAYK